MRPNWFHLLGNAWVIEPASRSRMSASVTWSGWPKDWTIASDLQHSKYGVALSLGGVVESVALGGKDVKIIERPISGGRLRLAMRGDWPFTAEALAKDVARVISVQRDFFGDVQGPFLVTLIPIEAPPAWQSVGGTGRSDAFALFSTRGDVEAELGGILGHEHIHSWIPGETFRMPHPEQIDYWISEGFTDFYAWRTQVRGGVWSLETYVATLNDAFREYDNSSVRTWPNAKAAEAFWTLRDAERLPYRRGAFLAMRWDEQLRRQSGGKLDFDNIIIGMRDQVRAAKSVEDLEDARPALIAMMISRGLDPRADIARYIEAGEVMPMDGDWFNGCVVISTAQVAAFERGWDVEKTAAAGVVAGLDPASPAYAAGLRDGMKILKREAGEPGDSRVTYVLRVQDGKAERLIRFQPEGKTKRELRTARLAQGLDKAGRERCRKAIGGI